MKLKFLAISLVVISLLAGKYAGSHTVKAQVPLPPPTDAGTPTLPDSPEACLAQALTDYMNAVIDGAGDLGNVKLLSPAFNLTSPVEPVVFSYMNMAGANFAGLDGFAGNTYTVNGKRAMAYYQDNGWAAAFSGKPVVFTEFGDFSTADIGSGDPARAALIDSMKTDFNQALGAGINGINYFDPLDTIPYNQEFIGRHRLSESELQYIISGSPSRAGLNQGIGILGGVIQNKAASLGMGWTTEIIGGPGDLESVVNSVNAQSSVNTVIRLCVGTSCGFKDPQTLIDFLNQLNGRLNKPVYVLTGPNEPASEPWVAPECATIPGVSIVGSPGLPPPSPALPNAPRPPIDYTPCNSVNDTRNPEFHSLRPYPASPCDPTVYTETKMCADLFTAREVYQLLPEQANLGCTLTSPTTETCNYSFTSNIDISVFSGTSRLPIMGNTELVPNSKSRDNKIDDATRMNEYASWYLNGTTSRAEEKDEIVQTYDPFNADDVQKINEVINLSGPIKKLLPLNVQNGLYAPIVPPVPIVRLVYPGIRTQQQADAQAGHIRHNQIVICTNQFVLDTGVPEACYTDDSQIRQRITPMDAIFLQGGIGLLNPVTAQLNPFYSFIPFSSTEDIVGSVQMSVDKIGGTFEPQVNDITPPEATKLYYPHMIEDNQLANILQKTFTSSQFISYDSSTGDSGGPSSATGNIGKVLYGDPPEGQYQNQLNSDNCSIRTTRKNPGDLLYGGWDEQGGNFVRQNSDGNISYTANFSCDFILQAPTPECIATCLTTTPDIDICTTNCTPPPPVCVQAADFSFKVTTSTPLADSIWDKLVAGNFAVFKRMFPRVGPNSPIRRILDIPAADRIYYTANNSGNNAPDGSLATGPIAGDPSALKSGGQANIYFPHIGSVQEYFLYQMQCALRPQGNQFCKPTGPQTGTTPTGPGAIIGTGDCSPSFLTPAFADQAENASCICQHESGGNPGALNDSCLRVGGTYDYSVGLFQINLLAHCPQAFRPEDGGFLGSTDANYRIVVPCKVGDEAVFNACLQKYADGEQNASYAKFLYDNRGQKWTDWIYSARACGLPT